MLALYYGGSEVPGWRKLLTESGIQHVALSYWGLRRRTKFVRPWIVAEKFNDDQKVFLDSGAHSVNRAPGKYGDAELMGAAEHYYQFAYSNLDRVEMVSEFDARQLGPDWLAAMRQMYAPQLGDKFMPIWHADQGLDELERLVTTYRRVGVADITLGERDLSPLLAQLVRRTGVLLHGAAQTKVAPLYEIPLTTVSSTSWLSPSQFGDTIVWVSNTLKRYPKAYKDKARTRHRGLLTAQGFDTEAIARDDATELLRVSLWSWEQLVADVNRRRGHPVTNPADAAAVPSAETTPGEVAIPVGETRNDRTPIRRRDPGQRALLPLLATRTETEVYTDDDGVRQTRQVQVLARSRTNMRRCDTCYMAMECEEYQPGHECAYDIPVDLTSPDQRTAALDLIESILTERALVGAAIEQAKGGYPDPNISSEFDRLIRFKKLRREAEADGFSARIEVSGRGEMGMISRIFGEQAGERARELDAPQPADDVLRRVGVIDAEIIDTDGFRAP